MPLLKPRISAETIRVFRQGLADLIELGKAPKGLPDEAFAQRIYALTLTDIIRGRGFECAKPMSWEFLVGGSPGRAAAVAVSGPRTGRRPVVNSITREPLAGEIARAINKVKGLSQVGRNAYELRQIRIAALSMAAAWLKSKERGTGDLVVPHGSIHKELKSMHAYPVEEFLSVLRPIAAKHREVQAALAKQRNTAGAVGT